MPCILVVEADDDTQEAVRAVLADEGFDVRVAGDDLAAIARLREPNRPSAVLVDLRDPADFLDRLARERELDGVNVILMSSDARPRHPRAAAALRMPFSLDELIAIAHKYCK
jgi:CheY-like chemotaxis protein